MSGIGGKADTGFDSKGQLIRLLSHFYKSRCVFLMPSKNKLTSNAVAVGIEVLLVDGQFTVAVLQLDADGWQDFRTIYPRIVNLRLC